MSGDSARAGVSAWKESAGDTLGAGDGAVGAGDGAGGAGDVTGGPGRGSAPSPNAAEADPAQADRSAGAHSVADDSRAALPAGPIVDLPTGGSADEVAVAAEDVANGPAATAAPSGLPAAGPDPAGREAAAPPAHQVVLITGISGSGKSVALRALEDAGFYCVDNLPPELLPAFLRLERQRADGTVRRIAIAVDVRSGAGSLPHLLPLLTRLRADGVSVRSIFLDASTDALVRRFSETRRRHPLTQRVLTQARDSDRMPLAPLADRAGMAPAGARPGPAAALERASVAHPADPRDRPGASASSSAQATSSAASSSSASSSAAPSAAAAPSSVDPATATPPSAEATAAAPPVGEAPDSRRALIDAIELERELVAGLRALSTVVDTSSLRPVQLRLWVRQIVQAPPGSLTLVFESFAFKFGVPLDADFLFDVRVLPNPHYIPELKALTGRDLTVIEYLEQQPEVGEMLGQIEAFLARWLPSFEQDQRAYLTVAIGCTGGQHRSVYFAEQLARRFAGRAATLVRHREQDARA